MPTEVCLVKVGMTMTEGSVEEWYVADGGQVEQGAPLYRLETEKVDMDVDADCSGTVRHLWVAGTVGEPGDVIGYIYAAGETIPDVLPVPEKRPPIVADSGATTASASDEASAAASAGPRAGLTTRITRPAEAAGGMSPAARRRARESAGSATGAVTPAPTTKSSSMTATPSTGAAGTVSAPSRPPPSSPLARRRAVELGVDLARVRGSGPGGRITEQDVEAAAATSSAGSGTGPGIESSTSVAMTGMRRTIARRMFESLHNSAQLTMDMDIAMDRAVAMRAELSSAWEADGVRPTYSDLVICATARALRSHPMMNSRYGEREITLLNEIHVGVAVALDEGLVVPVVRDADRLDLRALARETKRLADAARAGSLGVDDMAGGTFTVSSLGMFGVDAFTPILNAPQTGILGVNRIYDGVAWRGEVPVRSARMRLSLTWDHRVLDGAPAARFLGAVRELLEAPSRLLI